ncbi:uncharacterized protein LOC143300006 [Babylonia areolata]|uniref:uncharacterized protein LOC143300006 n=1 Tax=Babylonia areolata TaxID=304850 RepID=UPI003FD46E6F
MHPNKVNVAIGQTASVSSREVRNALTTGARCQACLAVDGLWNDTVDSTQDPLLFNVSSLHSNTGGNGSGCMRCDFADYGGWWQVDLGQNYTVSELTVYSDNPTSSLHDLHVQVDGHLCHVIDHVHHNLSTNVTSDGNGTHGNTLAVRCTQPLRGSVVRFSKPATPPGTTFSPDIHLCEVAVWACKAGYYGDACDLPCRGHCYDNTCDPVNGSCLGEVIAMTTRVTL